VDYKAKEIDIGTDRVKIQIWDTAGQERFRSMTAAFYYKAQGVILAFDVMQRESFEALSQWLEDIHRDVPEGCCIILCANKVDHEESRWDVKREEVRRMIPAFVSFLIQLHLQSLIFDARFC
jgi:small GTP-binding protein